MLSKPFPKRHNRFRFKPWPNADGMAMLMGAEKPQWLHQVEMLSGARHGDIKKAALFLGLFLLCGLSLKERHVLVSLRRLAGVPVPDGPARSAVLPQSDRG